MKTYKHLRTTVILLLILVQLCTCFSVLAQEERDINEFNSSDITVGVFTGGIQENIADEHLPNATKVYYNSFSDMAMSLSENKISCFVAPYITYKTLLDLYPTFLCTSEELSGGDVAFAFGKNEIHDDLYEDLNNYIITNKQEIDIIRENWLDGKGDPDMPNYHELKNINGHVTAAINPTTEPFSFIENNDYTGIEIDILTRFAVDRGYSIEFIDINFDSIILGITQDKYDVAAATLAITDERKQSVRFSEPYYYAYNVVIYNSVNDTAKSNTTLLDKIRQTFIDEDRYKLFINGLVNTLEITILSTIFGTLLASLICLLKIYGSKFIAKICNSFIQVFEGTPVLVITLVFYYIVFKSSNTSPMIVAIVVFSLNSAAFFAESLYAGIKTVDIGQKEAGLAMGYTELETFFKFVLPVAAQTFLPTYQSAVITLLKGTSIVSYITIEDLTKAGEIVRSRTYEPLIPLISVAIVYFVLSRIIIYIFKKLNKIVMPQRIGKYLKGVDINDQNS